MNPSKLTILGCGSAKPTMDTSPSGQVFEMDDKSFLIDCGEGIQLSMIRCGIHTSRLYSILISHLHGDHCFGLIGLLSTLGMQRRTQPMHIYAHADLERLMRPWLDYYCSDLTYDVIFHPINPRHNEVIFEDRTVRIESIPLKHLVPCCGFLFVSKHDNRKRYAYCSDTMYTEKIIPMIDGVDTLYHESTYTDEFAAKCRTVAHSTARQAATIAMKAHVGKLIIGHFSSRFAGHQLFLDEAKEVFENTLLAQERTSYDI